MARKKRDNIVKPWSTRQFLRPKGDDCGPGSVLQAKFSARRVVETNYNRDTQEREPTGRKYISLSATFSLRDCSNEISLGFYCSQNRKRAVAHATAIDKLHLAIERLACDYWVAIQTADEEGLWLDVEEDDDCDY